MTVWKNSRMKLIRKESASILYTYFIYCYTQKSLSAVKYYDFIDNPKLINSMSYILQILNCFTLL